MSLDYILVGLYTIEQIILEMSYMNKGKNLTLNRRVSLSFREGPLFEIFKQSVEFNKKFIELAQQQNESNLN